MKKWECPECKKLSDFKTASITGYCSIDVNGTENLEEWEIGMSICEECGFEENIWEPRKFKIIMLNTKS